MLYLQVHELLSSSSAAAVAVPGEGTSDGGKRLLARICKAVVGVSMPDCCGNDDQPIKLMPH